MTISLPTKSDLDRELAALVAADSVSYEMSCELEGFDPSDSTQLNAFYEGFANQDVVLESTGSSVALITTTTASSTDTFVRFLDRIISSLPAVAITNIHLRVLD